MRTRVVARTVGRKVAKGTLIACLLLPLATYVVYVKGKTAVYNKKLKTRLKRRTAAAPTPLSTKEQTQAQIRSENQQDGINIVKSQEESPLFKLPAEIRMQIYRELFSGKVFHIERGNKKLIHTNCQNKKDDQWNCGCGWNERAKDEPWKLYKESDCKACGNVPLLQSCRRVYNEAITTLYSGNKFVFCHLDTLRYFSLGILPDHLKLVTDIQLSWSFAVPWYNETPSAIPEERYAPYDENSWMEIWRIIAGLRGLKQLRVRIYDSAGPKASKNEAMVLMPLKLVDTPKLFDVQLPWLGFARNSPINTNAPYTITSLRSLTDDPEVPDI